MYTYFYYAAYHFIALRYTQVVVSECMYLIYYLHINIPVLHQIMVHVDYIIIIECLDIIVFLVKKILEHVRICRMTPYFKVIVVIHSVQNKFYSIDLI